MVQVGPAQAWVSQADVEAVGPTPDDINEDRWSQLAEAATAILFRLSGSRYAGETTATVRPSRRSHTDWPRRSSGWLELAGNCAGTRNLNDPCCGTTFAVTLGAYPVTEITDVTIDGTTLDADAYRVDGYRELVRQDGDGWPCCQNMNLPAGEPGTWTVTFNYGTLPDQAGLLACAELTRQFGLAFSNDDKCRLPQRVQTLTRQGVSMAILDPQDFLDNGRTGIYLIDLWLKAINPHGARRRARVMSPDWGAPARPVTVTD